MSETLDLVKAPVAKGQVRVSDHGYGEPAADGILVRDVVQAVADAELLEDYPDYPKGRCVLVLQYDSSDRPVHVVWGVPRGLAQPGCSRHSLQARAGEMERRLQEAKAMTTRRLTKLVREGSYAAEVDVELIDTGDGWSPYLSLDDAYRLDDVREALRSRDIGRASILARVFELTPVTAQAGASQGAPSV